MKTAVEYRSSERAAARAQQKVPGQASHLGTSNALLALLFLLAGNAVAQNNPHIGYVYPAGGKQGTTFEVKVGGQFLDGVTNVYFAGPGLQAIVLDHFKPITQQQFNNLRERLQELQKKTKDAATWREMVEIRAKIATFIRRPANPAIVEHATLRVTVDTNAALGKHEVRLGTPTGLSNPLLFCVGQLPEIRKTNPKEPTDKNRPFRPYADQQSAVPLNETATTLPATVNGQILPGGVDRFRFRARKGQQLVAEVAARELMPYLADAVPGWFQATLSLCDASGRELAYNDDFRFHPDPILHFQIPRDGEYWLEIKDAIYRGREDFVYRLSIGELPFVTSIFPLGGKRGEASRIELTGWNLATTNVTRENRDAGLDSIFLTEGGYISNPMPFLVDDLPEAFEQEPNDNVAQAQRVTLPLFLNGRINQSGDVDIFRFEGDLGDELVAEVMARRLDSPLDSGLRLLDAAGNQIAFNDDTEDRATGLNTHHADSYLRLTLPAAGAYYVLLGDTQHKGGAEYAYRLRLSAPRPDFAMRIVPSSVNLRSGASASLTAYALRRDGFTNEIALTLDSPPAGFRLSGARIPAGAEIVKFTLSAPPSPLAEPVTLALQARARLQGQEVLRPAVPAEDMMQAFAYHHLVAAKELKVAIIGRFPPRATIRVLSSTPVKIPVGGTASVRFEIPAARFVDNVLLELNEPPAGLSVQKISLVRDVAELTLQSDAAASKPGLKGNLIFNVLARRGNDAKNPNAGRQRGPLATLPAVPFVTVADK